jgi:hydroxypyruvate reductase
MPTERTRIVEAGHPVPDGAGEAAAAEILNLSSELGEGDLLIAVVSGGGSSLLSLPVDSVPMADLKAVTNSLLRSGAPITEMNVARKHLSREQGGRLAAACDAPIVTLIISDVTGDDPSAIASGPTCADPSTHHDALDIIRRFNVDAPAPVLAHLQAGAAGEKSEIPKPGGPELALASNTVIATAQQSLQAAADFFRARGITPVVLGDTGTGEAVEVAKVCATLVAEIRARSPSGRQWS